ncbi:AmmeMemoRadiSam system protein B [Rhodohalobacter sp. 614A]|uniref:AmmeMemoRadiSam system protein B n=1 Tax=Rhodohalobacter sp. 614A TaxID=2908649 RepID=UPI001F24726B|nr:AmmeMemoRadiSam system protein B [Rhodohalobacter sp. 614A]
MLRNKQLFHSTTEPVPPLRRDLQMIPIEDNGRKLLYFHDSMGYLSENFALDANVQPLLQMITGELSIDDIHKQIDGSLSTENLLDFVQLLDQHRLLHSEYFHFYSDQLDQDFEKGEAREAFLAGNSYPNNAEQLQTFVSELLPDFEQENGKIPSALYAPHIEISVGKKLYGEAFSHLKKIAPKRVVILATSHYANYYYRFYDGLPFIGSQKMFKIPGRILSPDLEVIQALDSESPENGFTLKDRAHRIEHSIEFHLVFASQIWQHDFKIVPILISGFDDLYYSQTGDLAKKIEHFTTQLKSFIDEETFVLISGDLSHVGQKFGDREPANILREKVEQSDKQFLDLSEIGNPDHLLNHVKRDYDSTRICGFPPLYTYLNIFPDKKGELLNYFWWDEKEQNSAVSFGSILF